MHLIQRLRSQRKDQLHFSLKIRYGRRNRGYQGRFIVNWISISGNWQELLITRQGLRIDTGDLARITGICERAVKAAEEVELKEIGDEEDAEREWMVGKLGRIENAILAANVIMLLITGRGTDQQVSPCKCCTDVRSILKRH